MRLFSLAPALAILVSGAVAAPAADSGRITLRGSTTIDASRSGWAPVRLPKDVDPFAAMSDPDEPHSPFVFSGDGRIIAFVLTMEPGRYSLGEGPTLIGWSFGRCEEKGCAAEGFLISNVIATGPLKRKDGKDLLPAGDYRMYLVQDGAPASIRFEFDGLTGSTRLPLPNPLTKRVKTLVPRSGLSGQQSVYWGAARRRSEASARQSSGCGWRARVRRRPLGRLGSASMTSPRLTPTRRTSLLVPPQTIRSRRR